MMTTRRKAVGYIENLAWVAHCTQDGKRWMAFLETYLDESGTHEQSPIVTVAGLLGTTTDWKGFSEEWSAVLRRAGLSRFHMKEFEEGYGESGALSAEERTDVKIALIDTINRTPSIIQVCSLVRGTIENRSSGPMAGILTRAYEFCCGDVMSALLQTAAVTFPGAEEKIAFVCDRQRESGPAVMRQFEAMRSDPAYLGPRERMGSITFADSAIYPPLQAADLVAGEVRKDGINRQSPGKKIPERRSLTRLKSGARISFHHADRRHLERGWPGHSQ